MQAKEEQAIETTIRGDASCCCSGKQRRMHARLRLLLHGRLMLEKGSVPPAPRTSLVMLCGFLV